MIQKELCVTDDVKVVDKVVQDSLGNLCVGLSGLLLDLKRDAESLRERVDAISFALGLAVESQSGDIDSSDKMIESARQHIGMIHEARREAYLFFLETCREVGLPDFSERLDPKAVEDLKVYQNENCDKDMADFKPIFIASRALEYVESLRRLVKEIKKVMPVLTSRYLFFIEQKFDVKLLFSILKRKQEAEQMGMQTCGVEPESNYEQPASRPVVQN